MLGGQPNHGWQLCFPLYLRASELDFRRYDGSDLKTHLLMRLWEPDALAVVRPTGVYLLDFFCYGFLFYLLLSYIFALSPFYILIDMF